MSDKRRVTIFGSTGSIGQNTLDLIRRRSDEFEIVALTGSKNASRLVRDSLEFRPACVVCDESVVTEVKEGLSATDIDVRSGQDALLGVAEMPADWIMSAIVGAAGLAPGLKALEQGTTLALANKESLVTAGALVKETARASGATIVPVDSEHSAVFQALVGESIEAVERIIITASGGPFRDWPVSRLAKATLEQALNHPNWAMGQRITIDSASMFNKAMEIIETKEFFDISPEQIEVLVHPESLVHALVGFRDGAVMAHLGAPDMRHAIGFALNWPERSDLPVNRLNLASVGSLRFEAPDEQRFPALRLAREVMRTGGLAGAAFNGAKEVALDAFIAGQIGFLDMAHLVESVFDRLSGHGSALQLTVTLENVLAVDDMARREAKIWVEAKSKAA